LLRGTPPCSAYIQCSTQRYVEEWDPAGELLSSVKVVKWSSVKFVMFSSTNVVRLNYAWLCVCVCVCVFVYVCVGCCLCVCVYVCLYVEGCVCVCVCVCVGVWKVAWVYVCSCITSGPSSDYINEMKELTWLLCNAPRHLNIALSEFTGCSVLVLRLSWYWIGQV